MRMIPNRRHGWMLAATLWLFGCASSPTTHYFSLQPEGGPPTAPPRELVGPLQITGFSIPALFDREELMKQVAPGQYEVQEFDHWAAPFDQLARQTLAEDLAARLPAGAMAFPGTPAPGGALQLAVNLVSFRITGSSAQLEVSWSIRTPADNAHPSATDLGWQMHVVTLEASVGDGAGQALVAALDDLLAQLSDRIVASLPGR